MAFDSTLGGASANSLVTELFADEYFADRPSNDEWLAVSNKTAALILSTDFFSLFNYTGTLVSDTQALPHPRAGMLNREKTGYVSETDIALDIKKAVCEQALYMDQNPDAFGSADNITELVAGPLKLKLEVKEFGEYESLDLSIRRLIAPYISNVSTSSAGSGTLRRG